MEIIETLLTVNTYTRPGKPLAEKRAVILHWVGVGGQRARSVWNFFETDCSKHQHYSSAHYCIDLDGSIYRFIPDNEVAYHCGTSQPVTPGGQVYTNWARELFGPYAADWQHTSPNLASIGIELCVINSDGNFDPRTLESAVLLTAHLCKTYQIPPDHVGTHQMVVGWKDCPRYFARNPAQFAAFKANVAKLL
jgi:N-acetylmuramoyl-L-alanine amidase